MQQSSGFAKTTLHCCLVEDIFGGAALSHGRRWKSSTIVGRRKRKNMKMLYEQRQDIYAFANIIVDVERKSVEEIVQEIKKATGIN